MAWFRVWLHEAGRMDPKGKEVDAATTRAAAEAVHGGALMPFGPLTKLRATVAGAGDGLPVGSSFFLPPAS